MLKRLAYLLTGSALLLLAAAMFWCFNRLNALTLAQQQTQRQIVEWHGQSQQNDDYHQLQATEYYRPHRSPCQTACRCHKRSGRTTSPHQRRAQRTCGTSPDPERQLSTPATTDRHAQPRNGKTPCPISALGRKGPFFFYQQRVSRRATFRRHRAIRLSLALTASACGPRRQRAGLAIAATGRQSRHFP